MEGNSFIKVCFDLECERQRCVEKEMTLEEE